jgi:alkylation response protein AidB-like acyl-CoA dehydrogenase
MLLTETQTAMRETIRRFAQEKIAPRAAAFEAAGGYPTELFAALADLGMMGLTASEEFGGVNADFVSYALALMEIAAADAALASILSVHNCPVISAILQNGTPSQKERFLPALTSGRIIGAFALTEADAGSDASAIRMRARETAGGYVLDGSKQFITSGRIAGLAIIFAVTDASAGKHGISAFLVPTERAGYRVDRVEDKMGQRASDTCAISCSELFVKDELRLGNEGEGYRIALSNLEGGRIGIAAQSVGIAQAALDLAVAYAKQRRSMGKLIIEHQAVGFRLAEMAAQLESARQLTLHAAAVKDSGRPCLKEAAMAKLVASETAERVCSGAMQTLGGYGYLEDFGVAKLYRDVRACQIYEGTSDIQKMLIVRSL